MNFLLHFMCISFLPFRLFPLFPLFLFPLRLLFFVSIAPYFLGCRCVWFSSLSLRLLVLVAIAPACIRFRFDCLYFLPFRVLFFFDVSTAFVVAVEIYAVFSVVPIVFLVLYGVVAVCSSKPGVSGYITCFDLDSGVCSGSSSIIWK